MWLQTPSVVLALLAATTSASNSLEDQSHQLRGLEEERFDLSSFIPCKCKSKRRKCLFIHGELRSGKHKDPQSESDYFGDIKDNAPCCTSIKYSSLDTIVNPWTDGGLQDKVCDHALSMSSSSDVKEKVIKNTIIVTHSMGALILAGAIANEKCSIDKDSTSWLSMSAPMLGMIASDKAQDLCSKDNGDTFHDLLAIVGKCPVDKGMTSLASMDSENADKKLKKAYKEAQDVYSEYVTAAMCSKKCDGIISMDKPKYQLIAKSIGGVDGNDGLVTYKSCRGGLPASKFCSDPTKPFYVSECNHADTKFLHGNDPIDDKKKPLRWLNCAL